MTQRQPPTPFERTHANRRNWLAGLAGTMGLTIGSGAGRSGPFSVEAIRRVSTGSIEPKSFENQGFQLIAHAPAGLAAKPVPVVFLFGGNGMGAVVRSAQADQMARDLARRGFAAVVVSYPNLTSLRDMLVRIVQPIANFMNGPWAGRIGIDPDRVGVAGFSAGGLIATLLATRYRATLPFTIRSSMNYYGPADLRQWFAFHAYRSDAADADSIDPRYRGVRGPDDMGHSPHGSMLCRDLSRSLRAKVSENIGGLAPGKLEPFSESRIWTIPQAFSFEQLAGSNTGPRIVGAFGTRDDNCDAAFQPRILHSLGNLHRVESMAFVYEGPHGVSWRACTAAFEAFVDPLQAAPAATGRNVGTADA